MTQSLGEYRVGISFNPSNNSDVDEIKSRAADLIDYITQLSEDDEDPEVKRLVALALTRIEEAAMWAVKAITKQPR